jgi:high-affinity Fe2+/Pb2+ permease
MNMDTLRFQTSKVIICYFGMQVITKPKDNIKRLKKSMQSFVVELEKMGWKKDANPFVKEKYDGELANKIIKANFADYLKTHLIGTVKIHLSLGTQSLTEVLHIPSKKFSEEEKYTNGIFTLMKKFFAQKNHLLKFY